MTEQSRYAQKGIDAHKGVVRKIFGSRIHNEYPGAFVNIATDPELPHLAFTMHLDGDGSKIIQRLLAYTETGDIRILQGAVDDAMQMNYGDVAASGFVDGLLVLGNVVDIYNIEGLIPKEEILEQIAIRFVELLELHEDYGFKQGYFMGGETADLPDNVRNMVFNVATFARTDKRNIIKGNVADSDTIWGFASFGQAKWENEYNSGLGANGFTQGRTDLMHTDYNEKYPHLWGKNKYEGRFKVTDSPILLGGMTVSEALTSPTRQYSILIRILIDTLKERGIFNQLHGITMNTGGGATKIGHLGVGGITYVKTMPSPPPIFQLTQQEPTPSPWKDMFETFNCGIGIDVIGENTHEFKNAILEVEKLTGVDAFHLGHCEENGTKKNKVILLTEYGTFQY